jgi:DNA-binding NarL/FixJ family response regulator
MLDAQPCITVTGEVQRATDLPAVGDELPCDVLLVEPAMDPETLDHIPTLAEQVKVVVVTAWDRPAECLAAVKAGADAVVYKRCDLERLLEVIESVAIGNKWLPPDLQSQIMSDWLTPTGDRLTARQEEVLRFVGRGLKNAEIAGALKVSEGTVKAHVRQILRKLALRDRTDLALYAVRSGLVVILLGELAADLATLVSSILC